MAQEYRIPVNSAELQAALAAQNSIQFNAGVSQVMSQAAGAGAQAATQFGKYQAGVNRTVQYVTDADAGLGVGRSSLGTAVMGNLDIASGTYTFPSPDGTDTVYTYPSIIIDTVLFDVSQTKNIVKTFVQGLGGSIKEYIAQGDYNIRISGIITGRNGVYPREEVAQLKKVLYAPVALKVNSKYLSTLGISRLVVEGYSFPQPPGSYSWQAFEITCSSDLPLPLTINRTNI